MLKLAQVLQLLYGHFLGISLEVLYEARLLTMSLSPEYAKNLLSGCYHDSCAGPGHGQASIDVSRDGLHHCITHSDQAKYIFGTGTHHILVSWLRVVLVFQAAYTASDAFNIQAQSCRMLSSRMCMTPPPCSNQRSLLSTRKVWQDWLAGCRGRSSVPV